MTHPRVHATQDPTRPAVIMAETGAVLTFGELSRRSNQCGHMLRSLGVRPGDHVALLLENRPEYFEICWAAINTGITFTPISTHLSPEEISYIVNDCEARVVFIENAAEVSGRTVRDRCPGVSHVVTIADYSEGLPVQPDSPVDADFRGGPMMYSSGTTGRPKGIVLTEERAHPLDPTPLSSLLAALYEFNERSIYFSPAPLYHTAPLKFTLAVQSVGGTCIVCRRFQADDALRYLQDYRVTHSQWVPTMLIRLLNLPETTRNRYDPSAHRVAIHAAAPCPVSVKEELIDWWGPIVHEYYGGTESAGFCAISPQEYLRKPGSVGRSRKGRIRILDSDQNEVAVGGVGDVYFQDGGDFRYHNDPAKTADAYSKQGWATMGDVGYVDAEGYLYLTDRKHDMIISGGVNIYPQETENLLMTHDLVADVAVFGIPNEEFGEEVKACVQLVDPAAASDEIAGRLQAYCREHLSKIKCPRSIDFLPSLPRKPNGKLHKRELKVRYLPDTEP